MWRSSLLLLGSLSVACAPTSSPGMAFAARQPHALDPSLDELARALPGEDARSLLVVHPREACSGSAAVVLLDRRGTFYGALRPGAAALLVVPAGLTRLEVLSSVEVTAPLRTSFVSSEVVVPAFPGGLLLGPKRANARECWGSGQYADARAVSKTELEEVLGETSGIAWLEPRHADGQRWLDEHRERLDEIFAGRVERCPASPLLGPSYCPEGNAPLDALVPPR